MRRAIDAWDMHDRYEGFTVEQYTLRLFPSSTVLPVEWLLPRGPGFAGDGFFPKIGFAVARLLPDAGGFALDKAFTRNYGFAWIGLYPNGCGFVLERLSPASTVLLGQAFTRGNGFDVGRLLPVDMNTVLTWNVFYP